MNETAMSGLPEQVRQFGDVIIKIVKRRQKELGEPSVPFEDVHFGPKDFEDFPHIMQGMKPYQEVDKTVKEMLGTLLWTYGEIESSRGFYRLVKHGRLYKDLTGN